MQINKYTISFLILILTGQLHSNELVQINPNNFLQFDSEESKISSTLNLFLYGKYEDYLLFFQTLDEKISWSDFSILQSRFRSLIQADYEVKEATYQFWIPKIVNFLLQYENKFYENSNVDLFDLKWKEYLTQVTKEHFFPIELKPLLAACYPLLELDLFVTLTGGQKKLIEFSDTLKGISFHKVDIALFIYTIKIIHCTRASCFKVYNAKTYLLLEKIREILLLEKQVSSEKVYEEYILFRSEKLGLDPNSPLNPVLTRIASILQLFSIDEGKILKEALLQLSPDDLDIVVEEFSFAKASVDFVFPDSLRSFLEYIQLEQSFGPERSERLKNVVKIGVPLVAKILREQRLMIMKKEIEASTRLIFDVKEKRLPQDLSKWSSVGFEIKKDGAIFLF
jgi:hypothetical protein